MARVNTRSRALTLNWKGHSVTVSRKWLWIGVIVLIIYVLSSKVGFRWIRIARFHPIQAGFLAVLLAGWFVNPLIALWLLTGLIVAVYVWMTDHPDHYRKYALPGAQGFWWAFQYRFRFAKKLARCGLVNKTDPRPALLGAWQHGCTTKVLMSWVDGNSVDDYRERADRIGPALGAQDCKIKLVYKDGELQSRQLELNLLRKNPFRKPVGAEYIDFHLDPANDPLPLTGNSTSMMRDGSPYGLILGLSELAVGETRSGKSNYLRARMYANRHAIKAGLLEVWGIDGKKGVELTPLEPLLARACYADASSPRDFDGKAVSLFLQQAVWTLLTRLWDMRQAGVTLHMPTPESPALEIIVDELLMFDVAFIERAVRTQIASSIEIIQRLGAAARIYLIGCAQDASMEDIPYRRAFPRRRVYRVKEKIQVDMAAGRGVWDRGGKADQIHFDQKGTCYVEDDGGTTPEEIRDAMVTDADIQDAIAYIGRQCTSVLWEDPLPERVEPEPEPAFEPFRPRITVG